MNKFLASLPLLTGGFILITSLNFQNSGSDHVIQMPSDTNRTWRPHEVVLSHEIENKQTELNDKPNENYVHPDISVPFQNINITQQTAPQNEPSVKISKKFPNRVVAAWRDFRLGSDPGAIRRVGYSYSTDSGSTWAAGVLFDSTINPGHPRNSDPAVGVDTAGNFYIAVIALTNINNDGQIVVYKSTDGGVTFPTAIVAASGFEEDKEYITTDFTPGSPFKNNIYISWTRFLGNTGIKLMRSTDGGSNWSSPVNVSDIYSGIQGSDPAIGANGDVNVVWVFEGSSNIIYYDKSTDGGLSFGTDAMLTFGLAPNNLPNGARTFPSMAADVSGGPRNGYLYVTFSDSRNGDPDVFLMRSTDRGADWSSPMRVNNDPIGNGKLQYWPWIAVNDSGLVSIIFFDTRNTSGNTVIEAYLARSSDGGDTFTNELLSSEPSPTSIPGANVRFGDYIGVDFWKNRIVPVWADERAGGFDMEIYTAVIDLNAIGIHPSSNEVPYGYYLHQNYPNPFNPSTKISFSIPPSKGARGMITKLIVYDVLGREVSTLINEQLKPGTYEVEWDASNYSSGIYFYKLSAGNYTETRKMILIK